MRRRLLGTGALLALLLLATPGAASAHVLKVDGHIGAVLHINPDDNPTTGAPTDYTVSFDDDTGRFSLPKCNCTVSFIVNGKALATNPLVVSSSEASEDHYAFPKAAVYDVRFTGAPKTPGAFQPFTLDYEVRVTNGRTSTQPMPVLLWIGMAMAIGLVLLAAYVTNSNIDPTKEQK